MAKILNFKKWLLSEIDWQNTWSDVKVTCTDPAKIVEYLNAVRKNSFLPYGKRQKFPHTFPFIHSKSDLFGNLPELNVEEFKKRITMPPSSIVTRNSKMQHSGGPNKIVYNLGVPSFRGIVYDIQNDKFVFINTCPGAYNCVNICYALDGSFIQFPNAYDRMTRVLNLMMNFPDRYEDQAFHELASLCAKHGAYVGQEKSIMVRWNDSGDMFSKKYRLMAHSIIRRLRTAGFDVEDDMYTKVADAANDPEFDHITFSSGAAPKEKKNVQIGGKIKSEITVEYKDMFKDLDLSNPNEMEILKDRIAEKYGFDRSKVITYPEMLEKPEGEERIWHVIVGSGQGDDAAFRKDVITILNLQHNAAVGSAMARKRKKKDK